MTTRQGDGTPGGYRKPARPAAVSAPRSGARTDGGAADKQPIRTPTGGAYGEAKALTEQQQGAPMAAGGPGSQGQGARGGGTQGAPPPSSGAFGPTQRPGEPITAGLPSEEALQQISAQQVLRAIYQAYNSPWIAGLIDGNS
ncbi:MAG: hypothetical protein DRQ39_00825 [Gammaproteobacteria bacterium]|nr:MAG: hypothetical protein DRQ39_00825 [Gammaproteobacteria bacterium]